MPTGYEHWNEEADRIRYAETDFDSPMADMSDEEIKERVWKMDAYDLDHPEDWD